MLVDDSRVRITLRQMVGKLTQEPALQEDLLQEALVHLWLQEERRPGQTRSWYYQSCQFHLRNHLAKGKSVDSHKRQRAQRHRASHAVEELEIEAEANGKNGSDIVLGDVSARDMMTQLTSRLSAQQQAILEHLSLGLGAREVARKLGISHPAVVRHRRQIAAHALKLGIHPPPGLRPLGGRPAKLTPRKRSRKNRLA